MEGRNGGTSSSSTSTSGIAVTNLRRPSQRIRIENPFALKVGQVFTGFGIGCGVGIGVGRPINIGTVFNLSSIEQAFLCLSYAFVVIENMDLGNLFKPKNNSAAKKPCIYFILFFSIFFEVVISFLGFWFCLAAKKNEGKIENIYIYICSFS